jgi:hypothetical protein
MERESTQRQLADAAAQAASTALALQARMLTYADATSMHADAISARMLTYADVC